MIEQFSIEIICDKVEIYRGQTGTKAVEKNRNDIERNILRVNPKARKQAKSLNAEGFKHRSVSAEIFSRKFTENKTQKKLTLKFS